jgi:hypothetical protein
MTLAAATRTDLNPRQQATLDFVIAGVLRKNNHGQEDRVEVKHLSMQHAWSGTFFVSLTVGMKGDEGTMAQAFCRDHRHLWIGKNGGVELLNPRGAKGQRLRKLSGLRNAVWALTES